MTQTDDKTKTEKKDTDASKEATVKFKVDLHIDKDQVKKIKNVVVAYSHVEREWFPTQDSYEAELEVEDRAMEVITEIQKIGLEVKGHKGDQYFLTNLLVDQPDVVINLVDTLKGKDRLQTSVPAALELSNMNYTGAGIEGLVIGNNRNLTKRLLMAYDIPTPPFQFIRRAGTSLQEDLVYPVIVKLNESGGSVGIDNFAVKENAKDAQKKVDEMIGVYKMPVIVEHFVDGPEITVIVFDDGQKNHVLMGEKIFRKKPDGKHNFTSIESYRDINAYKYKHVEEPLKGKIEKLAVRAFNALSHKDYAKFDIRLDESTNTPYFTDSNPNTAFGPDKGLPFTEILSLHDISFETILMSLLTKYGKEIQ
jgi:D-alanine-D-alanine ligase